MAFIPKIFLPELNSSDSFVFIEGNDANHVRNVLRIPVGGAVTICDGNGTFFDAIVDSYTQDGFTAKLGEKRTATSEFPFPVTVYQCYPKGDKPDTVVQKAVELGATEIVFVMSERCIARPEPKVMEKKLQRLEKIAESAAAQSGRGIVPSVRGLISFEQACKEVATAQTAFLCYEGKNVRPLNTLIASPLSSVSFLIGPEGGIAPSEIAIAEKYHLALAGLGPRILRTETAALFVLSAIEVLK